MDRYPNALPYQDERVKLKNNDYVNASFITDGDTTYIASQAPPPKAIPSFCQMAWEQGTSVIIMLTKLTGLLVLLLLMQRVTLRRPLPTGQQRKLMLYLATSP